MDHNKLCKILREMRIQDSLTCFLRNLYADQEATVRTGHDTTDWFKIGKEVRQGCIVSPCLFNFCAQCMLSHFNRVQLCETLWTVVCQAPLSMAFSRQEYWIGLPCPPPGDLPYPGIKPCLFHFLHWQAGSLPLVPPGKPFIQSTSCEMLSWVNHKLESRLLGEISTTSNI